MFAQRTPVQPAPCNESLNLDAAILKADSRYLIPERYSLQPQPPFPECLKSETLIPAPCCDGHKPQSCRTTMNPALMPNPYILDITTQKAQ